MIGHGGNVVDAASTARCRSEVFPAAIHLGSVAAVFHWTLHPRSDRYIALAMQ